VYMLRAYQQIMLGASNDKTSNFSPLAWHEHAVLAIVCALILFIGVYPQFLLDISEHTITNMVGHIGSLTK
jgi:NADH-quinone oxidoreductase subunit M